MIWEYTILGNNIEILGYTTNLQLFGSIDENNYELLTSKNWDMMPLQL